MPESRKVFVKAVLVIPLMVVLCLLLPLAEDIFMALYVPWEALPAPAARPEKLLGTGAAPGQEVRLIAGEAGQQQVQGDVYIQAEDGLVYGFELYDHTWRAGLAEQVAQREACVSNEQLFARKRGECVQGMEENGPMHLFVLDEQGVIWHRTLSAILPSYSYCATTGLGAGILIAAWMVSGRLKKEKNPAQGSKK